MYIIPIIFGPHALAQIEIVDKTQGTWKITKAFFYYVKYPERMVPLISLTGEKHNDDEDK